MRVATRVQLATYGSKQSQRQRGSKYVRSVSLWGSRGLRDLDKHGRLPLFFERPNDNTEHAQNAIALMQTNSMSLGYIQYGLFSAELTPSRGGEKEQVCVPNACTQNLHAAS